MEFLGVGPAELIVILVVALVFVGPERLPKLAADIARTIREIRKYTGSLAAEFNEVIQDFEKDTAGEKSAWKEIGEGLTGAAQSVTAAMRDARAEVQGIPAAAATAETAPVAEPSPSETNNGAGEARWTEIASTPPDGPPAPGALPYGAPAGSPAPAVRAEDAP